MSERTEQPTIEDIGHAIAVEHGGATEGMLNLFDALLQVPDWMLLADVGAERLQAAARMFIVLDALSESHAGAPWIPGGNPLREDPRYYRCRSFANRWAEGGAQ